MRLRAIEELVLDDQRAVLASVRRFGRDVGRVARASGQRGPTLDTLSRADRAAVVDLCRSHGVIVPEPDVLRRHLIWETFVQGVAEA